MRFRVRRAAGIGIAVVFVGLGAYAAVWAVQSRRFDERIAAFRASDACRELELLGRGVPADVNGAPSFEEAGELLRGLRSEHPGMFVFPASGPIPEADTAEAQKALLVLEPFRVAAARAADRPVVLFPAYPSPASNAHGEAMDLLCARAQLEPGQAVESADLLLRMIACWRPRTSVEVFVRGARHLQALGVVRDVLARDPGQARGLLSDWRAQVGNEEPLRDLRLGCLAVLRENIEFIEQLRRGENPLGEVRDFFPWYFSWYGRPVLYQRMIEAHDGWTRMLEEGRTEGGLRTLLASGDILKPLRGRCFRTLEELAVLRLARMALAIAAGEPAPEFDDPFTGRPLTVSNRANVTAITLTVPPEFRSWASSPELFSWEVPR